MKRCPTCQRAYTDDSLSFCLQDGTQLVRLSEPTPSDPQATLILEGGTVDQPLPPTVLAGRRETSETTKPAATVPNTAGSGTHTQAPPKTQSTVTVVALTVIATILLLGLGGAGAWLLLRDKSDNKNGATNTARAGSDSQNNASPSSSTNRNGAKASSSPSPAASVSTVDVAAARKEIAGTLNAWADSIKSKDINAHMKYYAATLGTYYSRSNVSADVVRADRERAFSKYTTLDIQITNLKIEIDPNGQRAVATFDKSFDFRGEKNFSGSGPNRFSFEKTGGVWRITGEKDLKE